MRLHALLLGWLLVGCSWITMTPPPKPSCTDDKVVPAVDAVAAVVLGVAAAGVAIGISGDDSGGVPPQVIVAVAGPPAALAAILVASSHRGFTNACECRALRARMASYDRAD